MKTLNELYSSLSARRRYEVWFIRLGLADGSGAWWFRYLLMNPGRGGCAGDPRGMPVQVWATWFPRDGKPQSFIQGFPLEGLDLSARGQNPFHFRIGNNEIGESSCRGATGGWGTRDFLGSALSFRISRHAEQQGLDWILANAAFRCAFFRPDHAGWAEFCRGTLWGSEFKDITADTGIATSGLGHMRIFPAPTFRPSTLEALVYEMPFGLVFRKAVLWHEGRSIEFRNLQEIRRDPDEFGWNFRGSTKDGFRLEATIDGAGPSIHRLPYVKTDCTGSFEVANNSLARAVVRLEQRDGRIETLETRTGAVLEMVGR